MNKYVENELQKENNELGKIESREQQSTSNLLAELRTKIAHVKELKSTANRKLNFDSKKLRTLLEHLSPQKQEELIDSLQDLARIIFNHLNKQNLGYE